MTSLLDKQITTRTVETVANEIKSQTQLEFFRLVDAFNAGVEVLWDNREGYTPEQILAALGTDAGEIFTLHKDIGDLIAKYKPQLIAAHAALIQPTTKNPDGTVTLV